MAEQRVICIGDIHGHLTKLKGLWENLEERLGEDLEKAVIVFLGDMCDRGPNTKGVLEWIIALKEKREEKNPTLKEPHQGNNRKWREGEVVILAGNHDFGFATYVDSSPFSPVSEKELDSTTDPMYSSGFYTHSVEGGMHYQGRRWGGSKVYSAGTTFNSYNSKQFFTPKARENLITNIPPPHHNLLKNLDWVYDIEVPWGFGRIICVHAGLPEMEKEKMEEYLKAMANREVMNPILQSQQWGRFQHFSGRGDVISAPRCLAGEAVVVSGHHGTRFIRKGRVVIDKSGGSLLIPLEAIIFPECEIVHSSDEPIDKVEVFGHQS